MLLATPAISATRPADRFAIATPFILGGQACRRESLRATASL